MIHYRHEKDKKALCGVRHSKGHRHKVYDRGWNGLIANKGVCLDCVRVACELEARRSNRPSKSKRQREFDEFDPNHEERMLRRLGASS